MRKPRGWCNGIVELDDLARYYYMQTGRELFLLIDFDYRQDIMKRVRNKFKSIWGASNSLGRFVSHFAYERNYKISYFNLSKLLELSNLKLDYSKILAIAPKNGAYGRLTNSVLNPKLPFDFKSVAGARFIASILCDGGINSQLNPHFTSSYKHMREKVFHNFRCVFGEIRTRSSNVERECICFPKIIGIILKYGVGLSSGRKVIENGGIPKFIFGLADKQKWAFISQVIDEEGHVALNERRIQVTGAVDIEQNKHAPPQFISDLVALFEGLDVNLSEPYLLNKYLNGKRTVWSTRIRTSDLRNCWRNIQLNLDYKQTDLTEAMTNGRYDKN